ncbi:MAG: MarR family transcriptional regulator [bacterium]|nr:MarR family transcriptional regulator [bacterium]
MDNKYDCLLLKNQICFPVYAVSNKIIRRYQPLLKNLDLTYTQYIVMMVMWEKEIVNEKDLVNALYLQANTLNPLLKKLEAKGLVEIKKDELDKRNLKISITDEGRLLKEKAVDVPKSLAKEINLSEEEAIFFYKILYKILNETKED